MRNIKRIKPFMEEVTKIWETNYPDWRFGQLMSNFLNSFTIDPFFIEEDKMIEGLRLYAKGEDPNKAFEKKEDSVDEPR